MGITPAPADVAWLLAYLVITLAYIGGWLAFAVLCSVVLRRRRWRPSRRGSC